MRTYDLKTGKKKIRWGRFCLIAVLLYIAALTIPYVQHKKVSDIIRNSLIHRNVILRSREKNGRLTLRIIQKLWNID